MELEVLDGRTLLSLVSWTDAITALASALGRDAHRTGGPARFSIAEAAGELLVMPAHDDELVGVKLASVAAGNPLLGLPRIQAVYVLFDAATLSPRVLFDGAALTTLRTPAQSALAVRALARPDAAELLVFGSGPQAWGHVHAIRAVRRIETVRIAGRDPARQAELIARLQAEGVAAVAGGRDDVVSADIVVCATTARRPVFDGRLLSDRACVVAIGSHEPAARELDDVVFSRAQRVVVEERSTALREAGDVIQAIAAGALDPDDLLEVAELLDLAVAEPAAGEPAAGGPAAGGPAAGGPAVSGPAERSPVAGEGLSVFKGVGMGWQDLAVAAAAYAAWRRQGPARR